MAAVSCTSLSEGEVGPVNDVENRRVRLTNDSHVDLRQRMNNQASEINRKRNIEEFDLNDPSTTPPERRPVFLPNPPIDSTRHNVQQPVNTRVRPID